MRDRNAEGICYIQAVCLVSQLGEVEMEVEMESNEREMAMDIWTGTCVTFHHASFAQLFCTLILSLGFQIEFPWQLQIGLAIKAML